MTIAQTPTIIKKIYPSIIWNIKDEKDGVFLTFDDGPTPEVTENVLDILDSFNAKASFFCIGRNVERYPDIFKETIKRGHTVGNHTYSHLNGWKSSRNQYLNDVYLTDNIFSSSFFRPPYGKIKKAQRKVLKHKFNIIMWSVLSYDFNRKISKEECLLNVVNHKDNGAIVVMHDSVKASKNMLYALPRILEQKLKEGKKFKALDSIFHRSGQEV